MIHYLFLPCTSSKDVLIDVSDDSMTHDCESPLQGEEEGESLQETISHDFRMVSQ